MWRLSLALMLVAVLTGCGPVSEMFGSTSYTGRAKDDYGYGTASELQPLLARRDLEEVLAERDRMIVAIIAELSRVMPGSQWFPNRDESWGICGDYGSTKGTRYFGRNWVAVFVVIGFWHGAAWTFGVFGLMHGIYLAVNELWRALKRKAPPLR